MALSDRLLRRKQEEAESQSVFGEILDWMLMPLLLIWPLSVILIQGVANSIADDPYDKALAENTLAIARLVSPAATWASTSRSRWESPTAGSEGRGATGCSSAAEAAGLR